jgi:hypothetical protein
MLRHARAGLVAAGFLLVVATTGSALAESTFVFGFVNAVPSGTHVSGARVEAVGVIDGSGRPVVDITEEPPLGYSLFSVPSGEQLLRVSGNCLDTTDDPVTVPPRGLQHDISVVNRSLPGVGDCVPFAHAFVLPGVLGAAGAQPPRDALGRQAVLGVVALRRQLRR